MNRDRTSSFSFSFIAARSNSNLTITVYSITLFSKSISIPDGSCISNGISISERICCISDRVHVLEKTLIVSSIDFSDSISVSNSVRISNCYGT